MPVLLFNNKTYFQKLEDLKTKETALKQLKNLNAFEEQKSKTENLLSIQHVTNIFDKKIEEIMGNKPRCIWV